MYSINISLEDLKFKRRHELSKKFQSKFAFTKLESQKAVISRPCGPMDKALDYESRDCRFESCQGRIFSSQISASGEIHTCSLHLKGGDFFLKHY
jgi:hypothetical protein